MRHVLTSTLKMLSIGKATSGQECSLGYDGVPTIRKPLSQYINGHCSFQGHQAHAGVASIHVHPTLTASQPLLPHNAHCTAPTWYSKVSTFVAHSSSDWQTSLAHSANCHSDEFFALWRITAELFTCKHRFQMVIVKDWLLWPLHNSST